MKNEFLANRVAVLPGIALNAVVASTYGSAQGVYIPKGAIIIGAKEMCVGAQTNLAVASQTIALRVGTFPVISTIVASNLGASTVPIALTLLTAGGVYVPISGVLNVIQQASSNSSYVGTHDFYVEYFCAA